MTIESKAKQMITMTVVMKVRPKKQEEFLQTMRSLQNDRMKEKGITGSKMYEDDGGNSFRLVDEWEAKEDLERYCDCESFKVFLGALRVLCEKSEMICSQIINAPALHMVLNKP